MLVLITGTPGSFKTTYAVWEIARAIPGTTIEGANGERIERKLYSNINGLLIDHQHISADDLVTWHEWAKPGDVILFDEVQHVWRPRGLGSKVPPEIAALETHRHKGVDIILVTQHPMLIDPNIRRLVNQHLHLRRLANGVSHVYEWDHCSNPHQVRSAIQSKMWWRKKEAFKLFVSAQAHTKTTAHIPRIAYLLIPALIGVAYFGHSFYQRLQERSGGGVELAASGQPPSLIVPDTLPDQPVSTPIADPPAPLSATAPPALMGCAASLDACRCYDQAGQAVELEPQACQAKLASPMPAKTAQDLAQILPGVPDGLRLTSGAADGHVIGEMRAQSR